MLIYILKKSLYSMYSSFLVINVCNQGKTLCSPCLYLVIMVDTLLLRPSLHFTQLHSISLHLSTLRFLRFELHSATLHFPLIWLNPNLNFVPLHCTSYHFILPHFSSLQFYTIFSTLQFLFFYPVYNCLPNYLS